MPDLGTTTEITAEKATIILKDRKTVYKVKDKPDASLDEFKPDPTLPKDTIADLVSAIKKGTPLMCDGNDGRKATVIFNAIYEFSRTGKIVELQ